jgi:hypothetical protein
MPTASAARTRSRPTRRRTSSWKREGLTIPDAVAARLRERTGRTVANLNFGRGAYGVLHMVKIGSEMAAVYKPELLIVQFITDDLTRGWWWSKEADVEGRRRALISASMAGFAEGTANDEYIVDPRATDAWCQERLAKQDRDAVLDDANTFYASYKREKGLVFNPWSVTRSYLLLRLLYGPTMTKKGSAAAGALPRIGYDEFARNPIVARAAATMKENHTRVMFVHLPMVAELKTGVSLTREQQRIWDEIERVFDTHIVTTAQVTPPAVPAKMDLMPLDAHPNRAGIEFYGEYVARAVMLKRQAVVDTSAKATARDIVLARLSDH